MHLTPRLDPVQVKKFCQLWQPPSDTWVGRSPAHWVESLKIIPFSSDLSMRTLSRPQLINIWRDGSIPTEHCFLSTLAWGGMKVNNGRSIWNAKDAWLPVCEQLRSGEFVTRKDAFEAFRSLRLEKRLPGMGTAYFTKLLFFARTVQDAYILDQWTARSIHILTQNRSWPHVQIDGDTLKKMNTPGGSAKLIRATVTDRVTSADYECYCKLVESIAVQARKRPTEIEEVMFGQGGRNPSAWRSHVMESWYAVPEAH